ncbi:putative reverse transcriptase domain-containing protein, partial [Tanacetum coccineum]
DPPSSHDPKSSHDDGSKPSSDVEKKVDEDPRKESECNDQEKEDNVNSTNNVNTDAIKMTNNLMDHKVCAYAARNSESKRNFKNQPRDNLVQHSHYKRLNVARAYTIGTNKKKAYAGTLPYCNKCKLHHSGPLWETRALSDYPKLKNQNRGNQAPNTKARGRVFALGRGENNKDSNVVTGTFLLNNRYAFILFDSRADRSFVSTTFSELIDVTPTALEVSYIVELADERVVESNTIFRGCMLNLLDHPFNVNLLLVELGSFDVIIGMDWLSKYHAVIICDEKIVRVPYGDEVMTIQGDGNNSASNSRLCIISCTKTQKYIQRGCHIFLAQVTEMKTEDMLKEKRLEDVPIVRDFPKVFSEDLPRLLLTRQVEFHIDLVPGDAPVA